MAATLRTKTRLSWKLGVALIVTLALLFCWSIVLVKDKLLSNADDMGTRLAESYAAEEQSRFATYEMLMAIGAQYLDDQIAAGDAPEEMEAWLASYASYLAQVLGADIIDPYAVIDGSIVAVDPLGGRQQLRLRLLRVVPARSGRRGRRNVHERLHRRRHGRAGRDAVHAAGRRRQRHRLRYRP